MKKIGVTNFLWGAMITYGYGMKHSTVLEYANKSGIDNMIGKQYYILDYMYFYLYDNIKFYRDISYPRKIEHLGKWGGTSKDVASSLWYRILN